MLNACQFQEPTASKSLIDIMGMVHDVCDPPLLSKNTNKSWLWACAEMEDFTQVIAMFLEHINHQPL